MKAPLKTWLVVGLVIVIGILIWWGNRSTKAPESNKPVKIGVIATLTGVGAYQGQQELRGLELARDELNTAGGINDRKIELIIEDSKAEPTTAVSALRKLADTDGVKFVVGDSWTSTTVPMVPVANEKRILLISPVSALDELSANDLFFRTIPITRDMMVPLARYAYSQLGARRVGILRQATPFGVEHARDFRAAFEALGGQIVAEETFELTATDLKTQINKVKAQNPDTILNLHATGPRLGLLQKQAQELGVNTKWLGSWGSENADLIKEYGVVVEGLVYPYPYDAESDKSATQEFIAKYRKKHSELPDLTAANAYDALHLVAQAIAERGEDPAAAKEFLLSLRDYPGASGIFTFDENGDVKKPVLIKQIQSGKFTTLAK